MLSTAIQAALSQEEPLHVSLPDPDHLQIDFPFEEKEGLSLQLNSELDPKSCHYYPHLGNFLIIPTKDLAGTYTYRLSNKQGQTLKTGRLVIPNRRALPPRQQFSDIHLDQGQVLYQIKAAPQSQTITQAKLHLSQTPKTYTLETVDKSSFQGSLDLENLDLSQPLTGSLQLTYQDGQEKSFPITPYQVPLDKIQPLIDVQLKEENLEIWLEHGQALQEPQLLLNGQAQALEKISPSVFQLEQTLDREHELKLQIQDQGRILYQKTYPPIKRVPTRKNQTTAAQTDPSFPAYYPAPTYPEGQCTWGVKRMVPWVGDWWGNAGQWAQSAQALGIPTGSQPRVGAIACWDDGSYGHVALVTQISSPTAIQVKEANYQGQSAIQNYRGWFDPTRGLGHLTYIYSPD